MPTRPSIAVSLPILAAFALGASFLQDPPTRRKVEANEAEALLERMEEHRFGTVKGGLKGTLRIHGRLSIEIPGRTTEKPCEADALVEFDGPRVLERLDYGSQGLSLEGVDETLAWMSHPIAGDRVYRDEEELVFRRRFEIVRGSPWRALYDAAEKIGEEKQEGSARPVLRMWTGDVSDTWVLDPPTFLPVRIEMVMPGGASPMTAKLEYSDWRPVGGVLYPFTQRATMGGAVATGSYDAIETGVPIPPEHFDVPEEIRKLAAKQPADPKEGKKQPSSQVVEREEQPVASIRTEVRAEEVHRTLAVLLPEVMSTLTEIGASTAGPPFARFHGQKGGSIDFEAGVPVAAPIAPRGRVKPSTLPGGRTAIAWYRGPYSGLAAARARLAASLVEKNLVPRGGPWIFYWTDPVLQRDPDQRRSQIVQPIE